MSENPVLAAIESRPDAARPRLLQLRKLILDTAARTDCVGAIEEALRWGQPSFLTGETGSGSTIRIDAVGNEGDIAAYFICHTDLVDNFRALYPDSFVYEANRALILPAAGPIPKAELAHCLSLALTYHARRKPKRGRPRKVAVA